jgi:hypothetical protein
MSSVPLQKHPLALGNQMRLCGGVKLTSCYASCDFICWGRMSAIVATCRRRVSKHTPQKSKKFKAAEYRSPVGVGFVSVTSCLEFQDWDSAPYSYSNLQASTSRQGSWSLGFRLRSIWGRLDIIHCSFVVLPCEPVRGGPAHLHHQI